MSLRETVNAFGRDVSEHFKRDSYCTFAAAEETEGFVETSAELDGSRGIAFLCDRIRVDFDGVIRQIDYEDIKETEIIESYESDYADELLIKGRTTIRVSDFSVNKRFLKLLVDTLCLRYGHYSPAERERCRRECRARSSARHAEIDEAAALVAKQVSERAAKKSKPNTPAAQSAQHSRSVKPAPRTVSKQERPVQPVKGDKPSSGTQIPKNVDKTAAPSAPAVTEPPKAPSPPPSEFDIDEQRFSVPDNHVPLEITEEKIEWLSGPKEPDEISESELEDMTHEQTLSYLLSSINEINAPAETQTIPANSGDAARAEAQNSPEAIMPQETEPDGQDIEETPYTPPVIQELSAENPEKSTVAEEASEPAAERTSPLTAEPPSEDIYIKASRKIREICESGRLTREEIQTALKENLVSAAAQFAEITGDCAEVPKNIAPKIEELCAASKALNRYFALGEDIAERVMFFMMYQMLSYSDRIVEAPETKERLNYFFKRYGPSGIMLSMLDMRVQ